MTTRTVTLSAEAADYVRQLLAVDAGENAPSEDVYGELGDAFNWG